MGRGEPCEPKWQRQGRGPLTAWGVGALDRCEEDSAGGGAAPGALGARSGRGLPAAALLLAAGPAAALRGQGGTAFQGRPAEPPGAEEIPPKHQAGEKDKGAGRLPPGSASHPCSFSAGSTEWEPCPGTPSLYPDPFAKGKSNSSRLPAANRRSLLLETEELGSLDFGDPASRASILSPFRNPNI